jgi:hypothetical protein
MQREDNRYRTIDPPPARLSVLRELCRAALRAVNTNTYVGRKQEKRKQKTVTRSEDLRH